MSTPKKTARKSSKEVVVTYKEAIANKPYQRVECNTIPKNEIPYVDDDISKWDSTASASHIDLVKRIIKNALPSVPDSFNFDNSFFGIRATDLFSLNTLLGATIEEEVVRCLNHNRILWDDGNFGDYTFKRSSESFPDVRLVNRHDPEDIIFGIELKSWFLFSKEGEPSMRFQPHPDACAPLDLLCVIPWYLDNAVCGKPRLAAPWIKQARYASYWSMFYWKYLRKTKEPLTLQERGFKSFNNACSPYPKKSDTVSLHPINDNGHNYGRLPRYSPIMDDFIKASLQEEILGIRAEDWMLFFKVHNENKTIDEIKTSINSLSPTSYSCVAQEILDMVDRIVNLLPTNVTK